MLQTFITYFYTTNTCKGMLFVKCLKAIFIEEIFNKM